MSSRSIGLLGLFGILGNLASILPFLGIGYSDLSNNIITLVPASIIAIYTLVKAIKVSHKLLTSTRPAFDVNNTDKKNLLVYLAILILSSIVILTILNHSSSAEEPLITAYYELTS